MTPEQVRELAAQARNLGGDALIENVIRTYDMLARIMPTEEEGRACARIASIYQEALDLQTKARLGFRHHRLPALELAPEEVFVGETATLPGCTLDVYVLEQSRWLRVMRVPIEELPLFQPGVHLALVLGTDKTGI